MLCRHPEQLEPNLHLIDYVFVLSVFPPGMLTQRVGIAIGWGTGGAQTLVQCGAL